MGRPLHKQRQVVLMACRVAVRKRRQAGDLSKPELV